MSSLLSKPAPQFSAKAVLNGEVVNGFSLDQFKGKKYVVLFFYTKDFSSICPYEMHAFQDHLKDFEDKDVAVVGCSTDSHETHQAWLNTDKANGGIKGITYPLVSDYEKTISDAYGSLWGEYSYSDEAELGASGPMINFRTTFLIDKDGIVQFVSSSMPAIVRNVKEILRTVDALQYLEKNGEFCPVD